MPASSLPIAMIAAVARNRVIGADNTLPWRLPTDMRHFKTTTAGKPVVMGRKTYESIGRPLPGRPTLVVSRSPGFAPEGVHVCASPDAALDAAERLGLAMGAAEIMVAGGGMLYTALLPRTRRIYLTEVDAEPAGDTLFPWLDPGVWRETGRLVPALHDGDEVAMAFVTYERF